MTQDEEDLLDALARENNRVDRPSVQQAQMRYLAEWDKDRLLTAAQGLETGGFIANPSSAMWHVDLTSVARKHIAAKNQPPVPQTINIQNNHNSPVQQVASGATGTQNTTYNLSNDDLRKVVNLFQAHGSELNLDDLTQRRVDAQVNTIEAELIQPEPDEVVVRQAGRTLRNVTEGAIGSLLATGAMNPDLWQWFLNLVF